MNRISTQYLRLSLLASIVFMWAPLVCLGLSVPFMAHAGPAVTAAFDEPLRISPLLAGWALLLSTMSGATALLWRIQRELAAAPDKPLQRPWLFCLANLAGSWMAGVLAFIVGRMQSVDVWTSLALIIVASFIGAKFIESMAERLLGSKVSPPPDGSAA